MDNNLQKNTLSQKGQTLIETVTAAFILTMGISAAIGLAIYAYGASNSILRQIIATGLAREGIEVVKNMRDTNWLKGGAIDSNCYNFETGANDAKCYKKWLNTPGAYNIDPGGGQKTYVIINHPEANGSTNPLDFWELRNIGSGNNSFGLNLNVNFSASANKAYYNPASPPVNVGSSDYYRKIIITPITSAPYNQSFVGPKLEVAAQVWWTDKKCPRVDDYGLASLSCRVEIKTYLTNWKNY